MTASFKLPISLAAKEILGDSRLYVVFRFLYIVQQ